MNEAFINIVQVLEIYGNGKVSPQPFPGEQTTCSGNRDFINNISTLTVLHLLEVHTAYFDT